MIKYVECARRDNLAVLQRMNEGWFRGFPSGRIEAVVSWTVGNLPNNHVHSLICQRSQPSTHLVIFVIGMQSSKVLERLDNCVLDADFRAVTFMYSDKQSTRSSTAITIITNVITLQSVLKRTQDVHVSRRRKGTDRLRHSDPYHPGNEFAP
jgi:hypothetical protein